MIKNNQKNETLRGMHSHFIEKKIIFEKKQITHYLKINKAKFVLPYLENFNQS